MAACVRMQAVGEEVHPAGVLLKRAVDVDQFHTLLGGHVAHGLGVVFDKEVDAVFLVRLQTHTPVALGHGRTGHQHDRDALGPDAVHDLGQRRLELFPAHTRCVRKPIRFRPVESRLVSSEHDRDDVRLPVQHIPL